MDGFFLVVLMLFGAVLLVPVGVGVAIGYAWGVSRERRRLPRQTTQNPPASASQGETTVHMTEAPTAKPAGEPDSAGTRTVGAAAPSAPLSRPPAGYSAPYSPVRDAQESHAAVPTAQAAAPAARPAPVHSDSQPRPTGFAIPTTASTAPTAPRSPGREALGINIALYMGGLVLTGAALSFVAFARVPEVTAISLIIAYLASAILGFVLAKNVPVLKPAGLAIFGTSLALLAVLAVPLNEAFIGHGVTTWLIVSLTGVTIYGVAAVHLDSAVLGYLVIPFLYSSVFSTTAVIQQPLVWTFSAILLIVTVIQWAVLHWSDRVPQVFRKPFGQLHPVVAPGVIIAALLSVRFMSAGDYTVLFAVAGAYYIVSAITAQRTVYRIIYACTARLLFTLALVCLLVFTEAGADVVFVSLALWAGLLTVAVWELPWISGVTREESRVRSLAQNGHRPGALLSVRRWDCRTMWVVLVVGLVILQALYRPGGVMAGAGFAAQPWFFSYAGALIGAVVYALWRQPSEVMVHRWVVRGALTFLVGVTWFASPGYAAGYLVLWVAVEHWVAPQSSRRQWQRGLSLAAAAMVAWAFGDAFADVTAASRSALTVIILSAVTAVWHLLRYRADQRQRVPRPVPAEALAYWLITLVSLLTGVHVFGTTGWWACGYLVLAVLVSYTLLLALARRGIRAVQYASESQSTVFLPTIRATTYAAVVLLATISVVSDAGVVGDLFAMDTPSAVRIFLVAAAVCAAEVVTAAFLRGQSAPLAPSEHELSAPSPRVTGVVPRGAGSHGWIPAQLSANTAWLTGVNAVIAVWSIGVPLWWFTAAAWACSSAWYYRAASRSPGADATYVTVARFYGLGMVFMLAAAVVLSPDLIAVYAVGAGALIVAVALVRWAASRLETAWAGPVLTASAVALMLGSTMADTFSGSVWGSASAIGYITALVTFLAVAGYAWWCSTHIRDTQMPQSQHTVCIAVTVGTLAVISLTPIPGAVPGELPLLAWAVPAMHATGLAAAAVVPRWRPLVGAIAPALMPLSALFAWSMAVETGERAVAMTALLILLAYLVTEVCVSGRAGLTWGARGQKIWAASLYGCASISAAAVGVIAVGSHEALLRAAPLAAGACLLLAGVWRRQRVGVFAGAAIIAISILWALRGIMFLFLVALGVIIMGAAVWRLIVIQKSQRGSSPTPRVPLQSPPQ